jgi:hypothetical protein
LPAINTEFKKNIIQGLFEKLSERDDRRSAPEDVIAAFMRKPEPWQGKGSGDGAPAHDEYENKVSTHRIQPTACGTGTLGLTRDRTRSPNSA